MELNKLIGEYKEIYYESYGENLKVVGVILPVFDRLSGEISSTKLMVVNNYGDEIEILYLSIKSIKDAVYDLKLKVYFDDILKNKTAEIELYREIYSLYEKRNKLYSDKEAIIKELRWSQGFITLSEFKDKLYGDLSKQIDLKDDSYKDYKFDLVYDSGLITGFKFHKEDYIEKYVKYADYDFLAEEYDYSLYIYRTDTNQYKSIINSYKASKVDFSKFSEYKCEESEFLSLGDKNWLSYNNIFKVNFNEPLNLTMDCIIKLINMIKLVLNLQ